MKLYEKKTSSLIVAEQNVSDWVALIDCAPEENETVWLYNIHIKAIALGCRVWNGDDLDYTGWFWAFSNGIIYNENGKIVSECEADDDYTFTHWSRLPALPLAKPNVSSSATIFEVELYRFINKHVNDGLSKTDLIAKMKCVLKSCEIS